MPPTRLDTTTKKKSQTEQRRIEEVFVEWIYKAKNSYIFPV